MFFENGGPAAITQNTFSGLFNDGLYAPAGVFVLAHNQATVSNQAINLTPADGSIFGGEPIANEIGRVKDSTEVYGVEGDYYFDVIADGAWTISIKAQG